MALCDARDATVGFGAEAPSDGISGRILRLDCPLAVRSVGEQLVLRVWWRKLPGRPSTNAERVISVLTPALEDRLPELMVAYARTQRAEVAPIRARAASGARSHARR
jgi:hypothetical protein